MKNLPVLNLAFLNVRAGFFLLFCCVTLNATIELDGGYLDLKPQIGGEIQPFDVQTWHLHMNTSANFALDLKDNVRLAGLGGITFLMPLDAFLYLKKLELQIQAMDLKWHFLSLPLGNFQETLPVDVRKTLGFAPVLPVGAGLTWFSPVGMVSLWGGVHYNGHLGSLLASEQDGFALGRYQLAWFRDSMPYQIRLNPILLPSAGITYEAQWGLARLALGGFYRPSDVPFIEKKGEVELFLSHQNTFEMDLKLDCNLDLLILKSHLWTQNKPVILLQNSQNELVSAQAPLLSGGYLGVEANYGDILSVNAGVLSRIYPNILENHWLLGVEPQGVLPSQKRLVHRAAFVSEWRGAFGETGFSWLLKQELGLERFDYLLSLLCRYVLEGGLGLALEGRVMGGQKGTPGWLRAAQSGIGFSLEQAF